MNVFRALGVVALTGGLVLAVDDEFKPLFDGKTLQGWTAVGGKSDNWTAKDGILVTRGDGGGWLSTAETYDDFHLKLEYRLQAGGNSGVFIRSPQTGDPAYSGIEIQILDDNDARYADIKPFQHCGSVYGIVAAKPGHTRPPGEWNQMEIIAKGTKIRIVLNDTSIVDADLAEHESAAAEHPGMKRPSGYIGLQSHSEPVEFRNVSVKRLK